MKITLKIFGSLIPLLGREQTVTLSDDATVRSLNQILLNDIKRAREAFSEARDRGGGDLLILVNGRSIDILDGLDTRLKDGDVVTLLSPFAGG